MLISTVTSGTNGKNIIKGIDCVRIWVCYYYV